MALRRVNEAPVSVSCPDEYSSTQYVVLGVDL